MSLNLDLDMIFLVLAPAGATFVKFFVDGFKLAVPTCRPIWPVLVAFLSGVPIVLLLLLASGVPLTSQTVAQAALAGFAATAMAIGLTSFHKTARQGPDLKIEEPD